MASRSRRHFVEDCARVRAEPVFFRAAPATSVISLSVKWLDSEQTTPVQLAVERVPLHLGGFRGYFLCPSCGKRRIVLISPGPAHPFACRRCYGAVYYSAYPTRRDWAMLLGRVPPRLADVLGDFDKRRVGVQRRRGVKRRAAALRARRERQAEREIASFIADFLEAEAAEQKPHKRETACQDDSESCELAPAGDLRRHRGRRIQPGRYPAMRLASVEELEELEE